jgi:hypothetical protein
MSEVSSSSSSAATCLALAAAVAAVASAVATATPDRSGPPPVFGAPPVARPSPGGRRKSRAISDSIASILAAVSSARLRASSRSGIAFSVVANRGPEFGASGSGGVRTGCRAGPSSSAPAVAGAVRLTARSRPDEDLRSLESFLKKEKTNVDPDAVNESATSPIRLPRAYNTRPEPVPPIAPHYRPPAWKIERPASYMKGGVAAGARPTAIEPGRRERPGSRVDPADAENAGADESCLPHRSEDAGASGRIANWTEKAGVVG